MCIRDRPSTVPCPEHRAGANDESVKRRRTSEAIQPRCRVRAAGWTSAATWSAARSGEVGLGALLVRAINRDVDLLVVEADEPGDGGRLMGRERVTPDDVFVGGAVDLEVPVLGRSLVGAFGGGVAREQQIHARVGLGEVVAGWEAGL